MRLATQAWNRRSAADIRKTRRSAGGRHAAAGLIPIAGMRWGGGCQRLDAGGAGAAGLDDPACKAALVHHAPLHLRALRVSAADLRCHACFAAMRTSRGTVPRSRPRDPAEAAGRIRTPGPGIRPVPLQTATGGGAGSGGALRGGLCHVAANPSKVRTAARTKAMRWGTVGRTYAEADRGEATFAMPVILTCCQVGRQGEFGGGVLGGARSCGANGRGLKYFSAAIAGEPPAKTLCAGEPVPTQSRLSGQRDCV